MFLLFCAIGSAWGQSLAVRTNYGALVLHYDPKVRKDGRLMTLREAYNYREADALCADYIKFLKRASGGQVNFTVVKKFVLDEFPPELDPDVTFTPENFDRYRSQGYDIFNSAKADYLTLIRDPRFEIVPRVERGEVDAVWIFAPEYTGFWETAMAGRGAYWINGGEYPEVQCSRRFVLYGFGIASHQGVGFMLENTAHMVENILGNRIASGWPERHRVKGWNTLNLNNPGRSPKFWDLNDWDFFTVTDAVHWNEKLVAPGCSQAGLSHFPPTACVNYGWSAPRYEFDVHWEANDFIAYGNWTLDNGSYSVQAAPAPKAILSGSHELKDDLGEYRVPVILTDADLETAVTVQSNAPNAHAGLLVRCCRYSAGENAVRGYYVGVRPHSREIVLARIDGSFVVLTNRPVPIEPGAKCHLFVSVRGATLSVSLTNAAPPVLVWTNLTGAVDGAAGLAAYNSAASFSHFYVTPVVTNYAEVWRTYPNLGTNARTLSPLEWRGDGQPYEDNDYWYAWWYEHLPKSPGIHEVRQPATGALLGYALNSWWPYLFDINRFDTPFLPHTNILCASADTHPPAAPARPRGAALGSRSIRIELDEPEDNVGVTRYEVLRDGLALQRTALRHFVDAAVAPGSSHTYTVKALDGSGNISPASEPVKVTVESQDSALLNRGFDAGLEAPEPWRQEPGDPGAVLVWEAPGVGRDGTRCICIDARAAPGDARWSQEVTGLIPKGRYRLTGWIKGQDIVIEPGGKIGANLCACWTHEYSLTTLSGTFDWTRVQCDVHADSFGKVIVGCRLGFWGSPASGMAWFDDLTLEYVAPTVQPVVAWGADSFNLASLPDGLSNAVAVACGGPHSLALKADGTVVCWGSNSSGQNAVPLELTNAVAIASGDSHCLAIRADGRLVAWGNNFYGQAEVPAGLSNVVAIAGGERFSLAVRADGTVCAWGSEDGGATAVPAGLADVVAVSAGYEVALALKRDGTVACWGSFRDSDYERYPAYVPPGLSNVVAITCGQSHCLALKSDGTVVAWGSSPHGETQVPAGLAGVIAIAAGAGHNAVLKTDGSIVTWGANDAGQLEVPARATNVFAVACGPFRSLALLGDGAPAFTVRPFRFQRTENAFTVAFESVRARQYFLLSTPGLGVPMWNLIQGTAATVEVGTMGHFSPPGPQRFYTIRTQPYAAGALVSRH